MTPLPAPATKHRIERLAESIAKYTLYSPVTVPANLVPVVFLPFVRCGYTKAQCRELMVFGLAGEHRCVPGRTVSGFPIFTEVSVWRAKDFYRALNLARYSYDCASQPGRPRAGAPAAAGSVRSTQRR